MHILDLPLEILEMILEHLSSTDLCNISCSCAIMKRSIDLLPFQEERKNWWEPIAKDEGNEAHWITRRANRIEIIKKNRSWICVQAHRGWSHGRHYWKLEVLSKSLLTTIGVVVQEEGLRDGNDLVCDYNLVQGETIDVVLDLRSHIKCISFHKKGEFPVIRKIPRELDGKRFFPIVETTQGIISTEFGLLHVPSFDKFTSLVYLCSSTRIASDVEQGIEIVEVDSLATAFEHLLSNHHPIAFIDLSPDGVALLRKCSKLHAMWDESGTSRTYIVGIVSSKHAFSPDPSISVDSILRRPDDELPVELVMRKISSVFPEFPKKTTNLSRQGHPLPPPIPHHQVLPSSTLKTIELVVITLIVFLGSALFIRKEFQALTQNTFG